MFSEALSRYLNDVRTMGIPEGAEIVGVAGTPGQGPFMRISLKVSGEQISDARFETYGCPVAMACGSFLTQWAKGKSIEQVQVIQAGDLERILGGLPLGKEHCAGLAVGALENALNQIR
jgi:NifU-like protein involved in Fe-S cluster formation